MTVGYLGLGSNIGDRRAHLLDAVAALPGQGVSVLAQSSVYETEPVGLVLDQRDFFNACVRVETALGPEDLLDACKAVEREVGRAAGGPRHGPRVIDVDLLLLGSLTYSSGRLTLPHAEVLSRRFVLVPLLELDSELTLPDGTRLADALDALAPGQEVRRVGEALAQGGGGDAPPDNVTLNRRREVSAANTAPHAVNVTFTGQLARVSRYPHADCHVIRTLIVT